MGNGCCYTRPKNADGSVRRKQIPINDNADIINMFHDVSIDTVNPVHFDFKYGKIIKVYDGDTYWIAAPYCNGIFRFVIRLYGVDCPELRSKNPQEKIAALAARDFVANLILNKVVNVEILPRKEKFGRLLANITVGNQSLTSILINEGHGVAYDGGQKKSFGVI